MSDNTQPASAPSEGMAMISVDNDCFFGPFESTQAAYDWLEKEGFTELTAEERRRHDGEMGKRGENGELQVWVKVWGLESLPVFESRYLDK